MQKFDAYKLLYNNLWLDKFAKPALLHTPQNSLSNRNKVSDPKPLIPEIPTVAKTLISKSEVSNITKATSEISSVNSPLIIDNWANLVADASNCVKCELCHSRKNIVIERGSRTANWMFVGEGPGEQEDIRGQPFVGASGQLLQKMIAAMGLNSEEDVYICNVIKCRPPANRNPTPKEIDLCKNYLFSQIELVKPQIIITLGRFAYQTLLNTDIALGRLRLKQHRYKSIPLIVTYHPAYLLRNPNAKKDAWADLQLAMNVFEGIKHEA